MSMIVVLVVVVVVVVISGLSVVLCGKRQYVHNTEEIELTKVVVIDPKHCNTRHDMVVLIHSAGRSTGKYFDIRQELRSGWVGDIKTYNIGVWFALALNDNPTVNEELIIESDTYRDIIQFGFIDNYYNLTLKAIAIQRWLHRYCRSVKYLLKIDDDTFVNIGQLLKVLPDFPIGFNGLIRSGDLVVRRDPNSRWYIPVEYYPYDYYPDYPLATHVAVEVDRDLLLRSLDTYTAIGGNYVLDIDDVFLTGILANWSGITRHNSSHFVLDDCHCIPSLHTVPIHLECKQRSDIWRAFLDVSMNTSAYCSQNVSPMIGHRSRLLLLQLLLPALSYMINTFNF
ncbi:beta-1,3-galactosyltransferase 1-like [Oppia nitens]|uniref:beta-1,3-galactosyltransferase 1-like n=1 Tax=Oppia nitens TaxID=1686743 RepID=UPI0023DBAADA|nr:beta-1,3-galactosyltransferase 1-like [Oppia nitens]